MLARPSSPPGPPPPSNLRWGRKSQRSRAGSSRGILLAQLNSLPTKHSTTASGSSLSSPSLTSGSHRLFGHPMVTGEYVAPYFLYKLYKLVDDRDTDGVISWNDAGSGFIIHQPSLCEKELLPKNFFNCHTLSSFVHHLTTVLGFVKAGGDQWEFSSNDFRRGLDVHDLVASRNADPIVGAEKSHMMVEEVEKKHMFDKVVTPSDVGKLNRLVIPKHHAEKYFPSLDGPSKEKGLLLDFQDGNGKPWRFRYSYWNSSQCYVMTKGWSQFVKEKNLDAGDILSFQRGAREDSRYRLFIDLKSRPTIGTHPYFSMALHRNLNTSLQPVSELSCVTTEADEIETTNEDDNLSFHDSEQELFPPRAREVSLVRFLQKRADRLSSEKRSAVSEDDEEQQLHPRSSTFSSVMDDALKGDSLQNICSSVEPMLRQFVKEEVHHDSSKQGLVSLAGTSSAKRIEGPDGRNLQLHFRTNLSPFFTGVKVEGEQGAAVHVILLDANSGHVVTSGPESSVKLDVVPLDGDFQYDDDDDWTQKEFQTHIVYEREGRRPLLTGDLQVTLKEGVGTLGDLAFTDTSNRIRSGKLRLGLKVASGVFEGVRIREAKSEAFRVKYHRNESYNKHFLPLPPFRRLEKIAKDGVFPMLEWVPDQVAISPITKKSRKKKTLAELRGEEITLLLERRTLKDKLATLRVVLEKATDTNENLKRRKGLTNIEEVQGAHTVGCAGRKDLHSNVWTVKGDQDHPIPLSVHADSLTRILGMRKLKVHNLFGKVPKSLPSIFQANSFVELHLPLYNHRLLWAGKLALVNLRLINLKHSSKLISLPDLSMAQKIVHLNLRGCLKLIQVSYIRNLTKLEKLNLSNCENIKVLPSLIGLQNLKEFYLSGCSNLWNLPPSIIALNSLVVLDLKNCAQLCELPRITTGLRSLQKLNISGCTNILKSLEMKGNRESQLLYGRFLNSTISGTYRYERASQFVEEATSPEQKKSATKKAKKISAPEVVQVETIVEKESTIRNFNWKAKMEKEERKRKSVESAMTTCKEVRVKRISNNSDDFVSSICQPSHEAVEEAILDSGSKLISETEPAPPGRSSNLKENTLAGLAIEDATSGEGEDVGLGIQIEPEVISLCNSSDHPREECSERVQLDISKTAAPCGPHKFAEKSCDGGMESNTEVFSHQTIETETLSSYEENGEIDWLKNEIQKLQEQLEASEKRRDGFRECYDSLESELWPLCAELEVEHVNLKEQKQKHGESELEASNAWEDLKNLVAQSIF